MFSQFQLHNCRTSCNIKIGHQEGGTHPFWWASCLFHLKKTHTVDKPLGFRGFSMLTGENGTIYQGSECFLQWSHIMSIFTLFSVWVCLSVTLLCRRDVFHTMPQFSSGWYWIWDDSDLLLTVGAAIKGEGWKLVSH